MTTAGTTTYVVQTVYTVTNKAGGELDNIGKHARAASHEAEGLTTVLKGIGAAVIGSAGIHAAKHAFIDFNREVQDAKISLSAMLQGNYNSTWEQAQKGASMLYNEFQRFSQLTPVTTQEMLEFGRSISVATAQAGGNIQDIIKITEQGVVAGKAMGFGGAYAGLEITEMLMGNVSKRMRFVQQLLGMAHTDEEHFRKLDAKGRLHLVESVLDSPALKNATGAMAKSFSGVLSTLEDKVQIVGGKMGGGLFEKVTHEIASWNEWLDRNSVKVDHIVDSVSHGLVRGFEMVKSAVEFIAAHADELIAIGKVWAVSKFAGAIGGGLGSTVGGIGKSIGKGGGSAGKATIGGILQMGVAAYMVTTELMKMSGVTETMLELIDPQRAKYERLIKSMSLWDDALEQSRRDLQGAGQTGIKATNTYANMHGAVRALDTEINVVKDAKRARMSNQRGSTGLDQDMMVSAGIEEKVAAKVRVDAMKGDGGAGYNALISRLTKERDIVKERADTASVIATKRVDEVMSVLSAKEKSGIDQNKALQMVMEEMVRALVAGKGPLSFQEVRDLMTGGANAAEKDPFGQGKPNQTNIHIDRVEVPAKDPDRWILDLDAAAKRRVNAPTSARAALRGR